ncbi:MAG: hypothetical protein J0I15_13390 [Herbaspirillum huttiense]|uniref:hypothetical protein n=1 Tax=Herbaspirillum huttiense TaxID=863372 RepID=UPI001AC84857|nr:hypothetical protein [Herbaspirillum huttiense]MBN9357442.1 hypothetical protein [Herbaspirillum huttiense]
MNNSLSHRELVALRRAAEDAIHAANPHYAPFIAAVAKPLEIYALVDMAMRSLETPAVAQPVADERAAFEHAERSSDLKRDSDEPDMYFNESVQAAWEGWQKRAALQPAEAAKPVAFREVAADGTPITDWIDGALPPNTPPLHPGATIQFAYGTPAAEPIAWEATTPAYAKYITDARYQKLHPGFKPWFKPYRCSQCSTPAATAFPDALTPELSYALGMPNFRCAPYAAIFRGAGHDIPRKAEAEQAFVIHRMVRAVLQHGAGWDAAFAAELHAAADSAKAAAPAGIQKGGA